MLRLTTPDNLRIEQSRDFLVNYGGSEANVAISIANFGGEVEYITRLPDNALGDTCLAELRSHNIKTDHVLVGGHRLGTYYMEKAAAMRNSKVIYDREGSAFSELKPGMIDWKDAFKDAAIFHWSGIDAALTPGLADVCKEAISVAKEMGLKISYDINYRKNLWNYGKTAQEVLRPLMVDSDIMFGSEGEYALVTGIKAPGFKATRNGEKYDIAAYEKFCQEISRQVQIHLHRIAQCDEFGAPYLCGSALQQRHDEAQPRIRHRQCDRLRRRGRCILRSHAVCTGCI